MSSQPLNSDIPIDILDEIPTILYTINYTFSFLSLLPGLAVFSLFFRTKNNWTYISRMSFCFNLANLIYTISNLLPLIGLDFDSWSDIICAFQTFSMLSCLYWVTRIALIGFRGVLNSRYNPNNVADIKWGFYLPLMITIIPAVHNKLIRYDNLGLDSDVSSDLHVLGVIMSVLIYIVPTIFSIGLTLYYYIRIVYFLNDVAARLGISTVRIIISPLCLLLTWLPMIICRIVFHLGYYNLWLNVIGIIFSRSSGFVNALVYGWSYYKVTKSNLEDHEDHLEYEKYVEEYCEYEIIDNRL